MFTWGHSSLTPVVCVLSVTLTPSRQVVIPLILDLLCGAQTTPVPCVGEYETILCLAERKVAAFGEMNGGFGDKEHQMFQNS